MRQVPKSHVWLLFAGSVLCAVLLPACRRDDAAAPGAWPGRADSGARTPAEAVLLPTRHLRDNNLAAFARDAVPPALYQRLEAAWRQGRSRWPLDELPFDERLPKLLGALTEPGSEQRLQAVFDRQFSGQAGALKTAATTLGLFGTQYVQRDADFSPAERHHYIQFVQALSKWGATAPLADPVRARSAIPQLAVAARATGLASEADFARLGLQTSMRRLSGFLRSLKSVLAGYGLRVDDTLGGLQAQVVDQRGDTARVRMRYTLGGTPVEAVVEVRQVGGRWYLSDYLRHAEAAVMGGAERGP